MNRHFVASYQKVANFQVIHGAVKVGGNVASYFCTPEGQVLHAIAGPVTAATFLKEARWVNEAYQFALVEDRNPAEMRLFFRRAHFERLRTEHFVTVPKERLVAPAAVTKDALDTLVVQNQNWARSPQAKVHLLLGAGAMPKLDQVYQIVFERILNERLSNDPVVER